MNTPIQGRDRPTEMVAIEIIQPCGRSTRSKDPPYSFLPRQMRSLSGSKLLGEWP